MLRAEAERTTEVSDKFFELSVGDREIVLKVTEALHKKLQVLIKINGGGG